MNSGDWVEDLTALEFHHGQWTIYAYDEAEYDIFNPKLQPSKPIKVPSRIESDLFEEQLLHSIIEQDK